MAAAIVALIVTEGFKGQILSDAANHQLGVDYAWRVLIGFGCVPGAAALYFRLTIPETPRYTMDVERNVKQASQDVDTVSWAMSFPFQLRLDGVLTRDNLTLL